MRLTARERAVGNVLEELPQRLQTRVKVSLHLAMYAETPDQGREPPERRAGTPD